MSAPRVLHRSDCETWVVCPDPFCFARYDILFVPDHDAPEWDMWVVLWDDERIAQDFDTKDDAIAWAVEDIKRHEEALA